GCAPGEANRVLRVEVPALEVLGVGGGVGVEVDVEAGDLRVGAGGEHGDGGQGEETAKCGFHGGSGSAWAEGLGWGWEDKRRGNNCFLVSIPTLQLSDNRRDALPVKYGSEASGGRRCGCGGGMG